MPEELDPALEFVARINAHDVKGLTDIMTSDYVFVDSLGAKLTRPAIEDGWRKYFVMVPDYWVKIERTYSKGDTRILVGKAGGTYVPPEKMIKQENKWEAPAVWIAQVRGKKIAVWRIYSDNEPIREKARKSSR